MTTKTKTNPERDHAIARLRDTLKPGDTVYCILRTVSRSGMSRTISFYGPKMEFLDGYIATACDYTRVPMDKGEGLKVHGCGMDMGFSVVYDLSRTLWPNGAPCSGEGCHSNDHSNGDRDYTPGHPHSDGGYALSHKWL